MDERLMPLDFPPGDADIDIKMLKIDFLGGRFFLFLLSWCTVGALQREREKEEEEEEETKEHRVKRISTYGNGVGKRSVHDG